MGFSFITGQETIVHADNASFDGTERAGALNTNGQLWIGSTALPHVKKATLTAGTGISISNGSGSITIANTGSLVDLHTARFIVGNTSNGANYSTIAAAIAAASAGDTIYLQTGTYTENLTLKVGVNLCAFECDAQTPNVTIVGTCTLTAAGTVTISGVRLQTNSANCVAVTGTAASIVRLHNCYIDCTNNTGLLNSSSDGNSLISLFFCRGDIGTTGIALFANSGAGSIHTNSCLFTNSGGSSTANTCSGTSSGALMAFHTQFNSALTISSSASILVEYSNLTVLTTSSTANATLLYCFTGDVVVGAGTVVTMISCVLSSSTTNVVSGAGSFIYTDLSFAGTSSNVVVTSETLKSMGPKLTIGSANTGLNNTLTVTNTSNTASSQALVNVSVGGATAGDAFTTYTVTGVTDWSQGLDNSASDAFVLSASAALGTTNIMSAAVAGQINYPLQPSFNAYNANNVANVTGDGTTVTVTFDTELSDVGSNFASSTFTAPVTGNYLFSGNVNMYNLGAAHTQAIVSITTTSDTFIVGYQNAAATRELASGNSILGIPFSIVVPMTATNTALIALTVTGGTKTVNLLGGKGCYFSGQLLS